MIKVGIVEDHHMFLEAMVNLINDNEEFEVVIKAINGKEFLKWINEDNLPDVVLVDVEMPIMDGPAMVKVIRARYGDHIKLIALSMHKEVRLVNAMIENGANGFITKSTSTDELFMAIRKVLHSGFYISRDIAKYVNICEMMVVKDEALNPTEENILILICNEKNNEEIAQELDLSRNTVNTYRTRMIEKLDVKNSIGLVLYAIKNGIFWMNK
jgi:DNA-binding NarL/FixJ family response regulator